MSQHKKRTRCLECGQFLSKDHKCKVKAWDRYNEPKILSSAGGVVLRVNFATRDEAMKYAQRKGIPVYNATYNY